jgi:hypothetical protein
MPHIGCLAHSLIGGKVQVGYIESYTFDAKSSGVNFLCSFVTLCNSTIGVQKFMWNIRIAVGIDPVLSVFAC